MSLGVADGEAKLFLREHPDIAQELSTKLRELLGLAKPAPAPVPGAAKAKA